MQVGGLSPDNNKRTIRGASDLKVPTYKTQTPVVGGCRRSANVGGFSPDNNKRNIRKRRT